MHLFQPEADIHLNHLMQNYLTIKKMVGTAKVMAVVKANAYGHGAVPIAHVLSDVGVLGFCVALAKEAEELIAADISEPILHLGRISASSIDLYQSGQVRCSINSVEDINMLEKYGSEQAPFFAHLKIDTGMGRLAMKGFNEMCPMDQKPMYLFFLFIVTTVSYLFICLHKRQLPTILELGYGILIGVCNVLGSGTFIAALDRVDALIAFPVSGSGGMLFTTTVGILVLGERLNKRLAVGVVLAIISLILVNLDF